MQQKKYSNKSVSVFFISVIILSSIAEVLICKYVFLWAYPLLMWMPALSAGIAAFISVREAGESVSFRKMSAKTGFHFCGIKYIIAGILLPLIYLLIPYLLYWKMHPENFAYSGVPLLRILKDCLPAGILGVFISLLTATGEEIGWRGFLVPALRERLGLNTTLLTSGLFWCLWHFPLLIWGGYIEGLSVAYSLVAFVLCIFPVGVICALLSLQSGSMWPCAFLHAAHNNYDQAIFDVITKGEDKVYYVGETGIFTIACVWIIEAVLYIIYRKKVH